MSQLPESAQSKLEQFLSGENLDKLLRIWRCTSTGEVVQSQLSFVQSQTLLTND